MSSKKAIVWIRWFNSFGLQGEYPGLLSQEVMSSRCLVPPLQQRLVFQQKYILSLAGPEFLQQIHRLVPPSPLLPCQSQSLLYCRLLQSHLLLACSKLLCSPSIITDHVKLVFWHMAELKNKDSSLKRPPSKCWVNLIQNLKTMSSTSLRVKHSIAAVTCYPWFTYS